MRLDERDEVDAMRALHRRASAEVDAAPDPSIRAAVLAAAARAVDAGPRAMKPAETTAAVAPFGRHRWPVSMAALLVVSLMTGLVVNRAMRDEPDRVTSAAAPGAATMEAPASAATSRGAETTARTNVGATADTTTDTNVGATGGATADTGPRPARALDARSPSGVVKPARPRADRVPAEEGFARDATAPLGASAAKIVAAPRAEPAPAQDAPAPAPPPSSAPSPAPVSKARAAAPALDESAADGVRTAAGAGPAVNTAQRMRRGPEPLTPGAWVERIVRLRESGDGAAADREVVALRTRYPDFEIPAAALAPTGTR